MNPLCTAWEWVRLDRVIQAMQGYAEHHLSNTPKGSVQLGHVWRPKPPAPAPPPDPVPTPTPSPLLPVADLAIGPLGASLRAWPDSSAPVIRLVAGGGRLATGATSTGTGWEVAAGPGQWWLQVLAVDGSPCVPPLWADPAELGPLPGST